MGPLFHLHVPETLQPYSARMQSQALKKKLKKSSRMRHQDIHSLGIFAVCSAVSFPAKHSADQAKVQDLCVPILLSFVCAHGWWQLIGARHPMQIPAGITARKAYAVSGLASSKQVPPSSTSNAQGTLAAVPAHLNFQPLRYALRLRSMSSTVLSMFQPPACSMAVRLQTPAAFQPGHARPRLLNKTKQASSLAR